MIQTSQLDQMAKAWTARLSFIQKPNTIFFFFLLLVLLPTQLGRHFWPFWSTLDGIRIDYLSPTLYVTDLCVVGLIMTALFSSERQKYFHVTRQFLLILCITVVLWSVSIYVSTNPFFGWYELLKFIEYVLVFIIGRNLLKEKSIFYCAAIAFGTTLLLQSLIAVAQVILQQSVGGPLWLLGERTFTANTPGIATAHFADRLVLRGYGTLPHPNVLAAYLLCGIIWITHIPYSAHVMRNLPVWIRNGRSLQLIKIILVSIAVLGLLATMSRLPIILCLLYGIWCLRKQRILVTCLLLICGTILVFWGHTFLSFILEDSSIQDRLFLLTQALHQVQSHPFFGLGFGKFITGSRVGSLNSSGIPQPVHNIFVLLMMSVGLIGALPVIATFSHIITSAIRNSLSLWMFFFIIILGSFDHYFLTLQQGQLLLVLATILVMRDN